MAQVLLFGWFAERAGWSERTLAAANLTELSQIVGDLHPNIAEALANGKGRAAVNQELAHGDMPLRSADEVAFFPPVSGG